MVTTILLLELARAWCMRSLAHKSHLRSQSLLSPQSSSASRLNGLHPCPLSARDNVPASSPSGSVLWHLLLLVGATVTTDGIVDFNLVFLFLFSDNIAILAQPSEDSVAYWRHQSSGLH